MGSLHVQSLLRLLHPLPVGRLLVAVGLSQALARPATPFLPPQLGGLSLRRPLLCVVGASQLVGNLVGERLGILVN